MVSNRVGLVVVEAPIEHDGTPSTWTDPVYIVMATWTHDASEPVTRIVVADGARGTGVWEGTRAGHLPADVTISVARQHLPPSPSWCGFGRREVDALEAVTAVAMMLRSAVVMTGAEMAMQQRRLMGMDGIGAGPLTLGRLRAEDLANERAKTLVRQAFMRGSIEAVERLRDDVMHRAHLALNSLAADPGSMGLAAVTRHLRVQAEGLIAEYHSY